MPVASSDTRTPALPLPSHPISALWAAGPVGELTLLKGLALLDHGYGQRCGAYIECRKTRSSVGGVVNLLIGSSGVRMSFGCRPRPR